jgi:hypothetical protein
MRLSGQLGDALTEGKAAKPGEKRERKDGYVWEKQRDGTWKRLHKAKGKGRAEEQSAADKAKAADQAMRAKDAPLPKGRIWIDHVPGLPHDTQKAHIDPETGDYTPERKRLHKKIVDSFLAGSYMKDKDGNKKFVPARPVPPDRQPETLFMMGTTASGKSGARKTIQPNPFEEYGVVEVDPDAIKAMLPEYQQSIAASAKDAAKITHEESSDIAEQIRKLALEQNKNVIVDGTGKTKEKVEKKIAEARGKNFMAIHDQFDTFTLFDNRTLPGGKRKPPTPIMSKPPKPPKVVNTDYFKMFLRENGITMEWLRSEGTPMSEQDREPDEAPPERKPAVDNDKLIDWFIKTVEKEDEELDSLPSDYKVGEGVEEVLGD